MLWCFPSSLWAGHSTYFPQNSHRGPLTCSWRCKNIYMSQSTKWEQHTKTLLGKIRKEQERQVDYLCTTVLSISQLYLSTVPWCSHKTSLKSFFKSKNCYSNVWHMRPLNNMWGTSACFFKVIGWLRNNTSETLPLQKDEKTTLMSERVWHKRATVFSFKEFKNNQVYYVKVP